MAIYGDVIGQLLGKRYRVKKELGRGAFGAVFIATHEVLGVAFRDVALKLFVNQYVTRANAAAVFNEAVQLERAASQARGRGEAVHLVTVHDIGIFEDYHYVPYMAMELVDGGTLEDRILVGLEPKPAVRLVRQICAGLKLAHEKRVYHRDLKPANVLFAKDGDTGFLKVADFGLAIDRHTAFKDGGHAGTISYSPPDAGSSVLVDGAFDVYSLGIILLEFMLKSNPLNKVLQKASQDGVDHRSPLIAAQRQLAELTNPVTRVALVDELTALRSDTGMQNILRSCLAVEPKQRYRDAAALDAALDAWERRLPPPRVVAREVPSVDAILAGVLESLDAGRHEDAVRDLRRAEPLCRTASDTGKVALTWSLWFEAEKNFAKAIEKQEEGMRVAGRTPQHLRRLAALFRRDNKLAAALATDDEAVSRK